MGNSTFSLVRDMKQMLIALIFFGLSECMPKIDDVHIHLDMSEIQKGKRMEAKPEMDFRLPDFCNSGRTKFQCSQKHGCVWELKEYPGGAAVEVCRSALGCKIGYKTYDGRSDCCSNDPTDHKKIYCCYTPGVTSVTDAELCSFRKN